MERSHHKRFSFGPNSALLLYSLFIIYGGLYPFQGWQEPQFDDFFAQFLEGGQTIVVFDVVQNLCFFIPLGWMSFYIQPKHLLNCIGVFFLCSACIETWQMYLPSRTSSFLDISLNTLSGLMGWIMAQHSQRLCERPFANIRKVLKHSWVSQPYCLFGALGLWGLWLAYHLAPFLPTFHPDHLRWGLIPLVDNLHPSGWNTLKIVHYALQGIGLGVVGLFLFPICAQYCMYSSSLIGILSLKIFIIGRSLSSEALLGLCIGLMIVPLLLNIKRKGAQ